MRSSPVDLSSVDLALVREILSRNGVSADNAPMIFGSRVTGRARRYSDLDIGFAGEPLRLRALARLREDLEESRLPISVDVLNLSETGPELRKHALSSAVPLEHARGSVS